MLKNPRINVTFENTIAVLLIHLAQRENKSVACLVRELTLNSLETREDIYLSKVAEKIDKNGAKTYSHREAWK
jgi:predicted DNA-binding protein